MEVQRRVLVSEEEFLALPETTNKVELLDGEVIVAPSPNFWHQEVVKRLVRSLDDWAADAGGDFTVCQSPLDVRFQPGRILQPDAFVLAGTVSRDHQGPIERVPLVCIEVLSTNRVYDRVTKRMIYGAAGVVEYWAVEPARLPFGLVERFFGSGLNLSEELQDRLASPALPGFELDIASLFADVG